LIESGQTKETRKARRRAAKAPSTMRTDGREPVDVVVLDISRSGVRILTDAELTVGQEISIGLAGAGVTRAFVTWARDGEYGCAFERPIAPEDEARAFSQAPVKRLGRATVEHSASDSDRDDDYLRELYRHHRIWAVPWDAVAMAVAMAALLWAVVRL
jgi:hypothetical protein